jgi:hypothetical protein
MLTVNISAAMVRHQTRGNEMTQTIKAGTRIELNGTPAMGGFPGVSPETAVIGQWRKSVSGPRDGRMAGYHVVKFADGGKLLVHETRFRVIDNR